MKKLFLGTAITLGLLVPVAANADETFPHFLPDNLWHYMIVLPDIGGGDKQGGVFETTLDGEGWKTEAICIQKAKEFAAHMHGSPGGDLVCVYIPR